MFSKILKQVQDDNSYEYAKFLSDVVRIFDLGFCVESGADVFGVEGISETWIIGFSTAVWIGSRKDSVSRGIGDFIIRVGDVARGRERVFENYSCRVIDWIG